MPVCKDTEVTRAMGSHELDECIRPAEWAVDPGLAGLLHHLQNGLVVGASDNILDDRAPAVHLILALAVRAGCAPRSIPAVITGQDYCCRNPRTIYSHAALSVVGVL